MYGVHVETVLLDLSKKVMILEVYWVYVIGALYPCQTNSPDSSDDSSSCIVHNGVGQGAKAWIASFTFPLSGEERSSIRYQLWEQPNGITPNLLTCTDGNSFLWNSPKMLLLAHSLARESLTTSGWSADEDKLTLYLSTW